MTIPAPLPLTLYQGDSFSLFVRIKARDAGGTLVYQNLTGCTVKAQIRLNTEAPQVIAEFSANITEQVTLTGGIVLLLTPAQTAAMTELKAVWDCEVLYSNGDKRTFLAGSVALVKEVTHA